MAALIVLNDGNDNDNDDGDDDDDNDGDDDDDEEDGKSSCWQVGAELVANGGSGFTQCEPAVGLQCTVHSSVEDCSINVQQNCNLHTGCKSAHWLQSCTHCAVFTAVTSAAGSLNVQLLHCAL